MSLVGFRAQNHPQQKTKDRVDDRCVLAEFFEPLHAQYKFTVDAAASDDNHLLPKYWTKETDGLAQSWAGESVWCNPPYSDIEPWLKKAWREMNGDERHGRFTSIAMLLPANRCEQGWWQRHVEPFRDRLSFGIYLRTTFLPGRMRFKHPADWEKPVKGDRPPFGCVLLKWSRY